MATFDPTWIIREPVRVRTDGAGIGAGYVVESMPDASGGYRSARLSTWDGKLLINNCYVDLGDDFISYVSVLDATGEAEPGTWVHSEPYVDES